jgi:hypothetical protein
MINHCKVESSTRRIPNRPYRWPTAQTPELRKLQSIVFLIFMDIGISACTATALRRTTVDIGLSVNAIQEQQVLENIARFADQPDGLPAQLVLTGGAVQVSQNATGSLKAPYTLTLKNSKELDVG